MNSFEKNKLTLLTELEKKKEIRDFLIKERKRLLKPTVYSSCFFIIIIIMIALINIGAGILAMVFFGAISGIISCKTYFHNPKAYKIEDELVSIQENILKLEIEKINLNSLEIKTLISE
jgi:hypothetical protein